jgi:hypothetical protein
MSTADLRRFNSAPSGGARPREPAAPDYHALGTFSETWAFLELFVGRCVVELGAPPPPGLAGKLDALEARLDAARPSRRREAAALIDEVRAVALQREAALQDLARSSLHRMGLNILEPAPDLPNAAASPFEQRPIETLHMQACDLVRRSAMLLCALKADR